MVNCEQCNSHQFKLIKISANLQYNKCKTCGIEKINLQNGISLKAYFEEQQEHFYGQSPELTPLQKFCENDEANYHIKKLKKYLKKNPKVLEIGPGNGTFASKLIELGYETSLVDQSPETLKRLNKKFQCNLILGEFESQVKDGETYDAIFSFHVIEHIADFQQQIKTAYEKLVPNGLFIVATPNTSSFHHRLPWRLSPHYDYAHLTLFNKHNLKYELEDTGFVIEQVYTPEFSIYWPRVITKILRKFLRKNEADTAGHYIGNSNRLVINFFYLYAICSLPLRALQGLLGFGSELFIIAKKKI